MSLVSIDRDGHVGSVTFNRPEKLNAFTPGMLEEFAIAIDELDSDDNVRCIIVSGEGRAFSVGFDVGGRSESAAESESAGARHSSHDEWLALRRRVEICSSVWRCSTPTLASVHGYCMGGATIISACCDLSVVSSDAVIGWPVLPLGGGYLSPISAWLIGPKKAKELSFIAGSRMTGDEAAALGWANYAVDPAELADRTRSIAARIAKTPLDLLHLKKRALNRIFDLQGFSESTLFGAEFDTLAHTLDSTALMREKVRELGIRGATAWFENEGI
jgi:enoyl-CoA hydratase